MNTYKLNLNEEHLKVINLALMGAPYGSAAPVVAHINAEIARLYNEQYDKQRELKQEPLAHHPV